MVGPRVVIHLALVIISIQKEWNVGQGGKAIPLSRSLQHGEMQIISAATGMTHSEYNASNSKDVKLLQKWILYHFLSYYQVGCINLKAKESITLE